MDLFEFINNVKEPIKPELMLRIISGTNHPAAALSRYVNSPLAVNSGTETMAMLLLGFLEVIYETCDYLCGVLLKYTVKDEHVCLALNNYASILDSTRTFLESIMNETSKENIMINAIALNEHMNRIVKSTNMIQQELSELIG